MDPNDKSQAKSEGVTENEATMVQPTIDSAPASTVITPGQQPDATPAAPAAFTPSAGSSPSGGSFLKSKKAKLVALIVVAVAVLGGGGAAAYYGVVAPNQPQAVVKQALTNTINQENVKSGYFEGEITFSGGDIEKTVSGVTFEGASNEAGSIDLKLGVNTAVTKVNLDVRSTDSKTFYLKLSGLNGLDTLLTQGMSMNGGDSSYATIILPILQQVNDKWYSVDQSLLSQAAGSQADLLSRDSKINADDAKKLGDIYKKHQFIQIDKKLGDEKIHGVDSYHIQASVNKDQLTAFMEEVKAANIKSVAVDQKTIDEVKKVDFSKYPFDLWVSKSNKLITQVATTIEESGTKYAFRVALYDVNKAVTVEKPADSKSVLELLGEIAPLVSGTSAASDLPL